MRKRFIGILMATTMVFSLAGCGASEQTVSEQTEAESVVEVEQEASEAESESVEVEPETEQAEDNESVENLEGFEYHLTFDVDGTQKVIGFNTPEGYEIGYKGEQYYEFINLNRDSFTIMPIYDDLASVYENYLSTGEWRGTNKDSEEEFLSERTVEVPGGNALIITGSLDDFMKWQSVFVDFGDCIVFVQTPLSCLGEEIVSGTEEEYIIDEVLADLFVETDNTEYLYPITESTVEITEGTYEYILTDFEPKVQSKVAYFGFNLPEGDFAKNEENLAFYDFTDSNGNKFEISETNNMGDLYEDLGVYRHFLRTGEMTEGVENHISNEDFTVWQSGKLVDMQLGETVETLYGTAYIVKGLWQYDTFTEVSETVMFNVNDREVVITYHNRNAEAGTTLNSYESQLKDMLAVMF